MTLLPFARKSAAVASPAAVPEIRSFLKGYSIEVMPRTAAKIESFRAFLPVDTCVYIAHIEGTPIEDMVATAKRLANEGFPVMPHIPARLIRNREMLADWISRYQQEAGIDQALLIAGGVAKPIGPYHSSMQLMETGLFDRAGFKQLHVAGHPEGCRDIDADGSDKMVMAALRWKQQFMERTDARIALTTQFCFEAAPVIKWANRLKAAGIDMPIHIGVAGPAKLQTLIRFSLACGVGPSMKVLQRRARDMTRLLKPFEPTAFIAELAAHWAGNPDFNIEKVHFFPLGGIRPAADWAIENGGFTAVQAA
jgi:methylenetetrahydrofolate reductase (NADPH)